MRLGLFWPVLLVVVFLLLSSHVDAKRKKPKKFKDTTKDSDSVSSEEPKSETEIRFNNINDLHSQIDDLKKKKQFDPKVLETVLSPQERAKLESEELELRKQVYLAAIDHGDLSEQKIFALNKLGRNVYLQGKYDDSLEISSSILNMNERLYGRNDVKTAQALNNLGSVLFRMKNSERCEIVMKRALDILIQEHGLQSKEVLLQRGKLLSFGISDGEHTEGISYEEYMNYHNDLEEL